MNDLSVQILVIALSGVASIAGSLSFFILISIKGEIKKNRDTNDDQERRIVRLETRAGIS